MTMMLDLAPPRSAFAEVVGAFAAALDPRRSDTTAVAPDNWREWCPTLFPDTFTSDFASHHASFWEHVDRIQQGNRVEPYFAVWARGGGKTTNLETAVVWLGATARRRFCLYVRGVQEKANESVRSISNLVESGNFELYYPSMAQRQVGKFGNQLGWRMDMLRCGNGFNVLALGLDAAVRGVKLGERRPDLIVLDDIDDQLDNPKTIKKKISVLTKSILPAGSSNVVVLCGQNLIHQNGIVSGVVNRTSGFLYNAVVNGPVPAVRGLVVERCPDGRGHVVIAGEPTWEAGQGLDVVEAQINLWGLPAFLEEAQHEVEESGGHWDDVEFEHVVLQDVPELVAGEVWVDPAVTAHDGSDSHALIADGMGVDGRLYRLYAWEEVSTPEDSVQRAIEVCLDYGLDAVGVETNQGGLTWKSVYDRVWERMLQNGELGQWIRIDEDGNEILPTKPKFKEVKATASDGSKIYRNQQMKADYANGRIVHVVGTTAVLERALRRFPKKPMDLADSAYWGWVHVFRRKRAGQVLAQGKVKDRR